MIHKLPPLWRVFCCVRKERYIKMGKGTRSRNSRAGEVVADPTKFSKKGREDKSAVYTRIGVICCAVLLAACLLLWGATSLLPRIRTAARSEHYKVSGSEMTYFINSNKNAFLSSMSYYSSYLTSLGMNTSDTSLTALKSQTCGLTDDGSSWYDYFADQTKTQVESILVLCEAAREEGMKLDSDELAEIKQSLKDLKKSAEETAEYYASLGYSGYTASYLLAQEFGNGVSESNVRSAMELQALAIKYQNAFLERTKDALTDAEIDQYVKDNPEDLQTAQVFSYKFAATLDVAGAEATDDEKAAYETAKAEAKALAEALAAVSDKDAFVEKARDYIVSTYAEKSFDESYETNKKNITEGDLPTEAVLNKDKADIVAAVAAKVKGGDDLKKYADNSEYAESYAKVLDTVASAVLSDVQAEYSTFDSESDVSYSDPAADDATDSDKWLFAEDRKAGDTTVISDEADAASGYTAYFLVTPSHIDETITKNAGHILFKTTTYDNDAAKAKEKAEEVLAIYNNGEKTKEAFEALANEYTEDGSVFYENIAKDYMVEEFDAWIYDEARKPGDVEIVETASYGAHIMYFVGDGEPAWKITATDGLCNDKYDAWYETAKTSAGVSFNDSAISTLG